jgi:hypothetical protein
MTNDNPTVLLHIFMRPMVGRLWPRARSHCTITDPNDNHYHRYEYAIAGNGHGNGRTFGNGRSPTG